MKNNLLEVPQDNSQKPEKSKEYKKCYTCNPRGKIKKYIISTSTDGSFKFHHDMSHRPVILVTPTYHAKSINDITNIQNLFLEITSFCDFWNIVDYTIKFSRDSTRLSEHFHIKIEAEPKAVNRMRGDHFRRLSLIQNYIAL